MALPAAAVRLLHAGAAGAVLAAGLSYGAPAAGADASSSGLLRVAFEPGIGNIEYQVSELRPDPPDGVAPATGLEGEIWYGSIARRQPGQGPADTPLLLGFATAYLLGMPVAAICDLDGDGALIDEAPQRLYDYPASPGARAFVAELRWSARSRSGEEIPIRRTVRVVLQSAADGHDPGYRLQLVHAMLGTVTLGNRPHRTFLFDGSGDGLYGREPMDGLFVDLDDDRRLTVDPHSPEFGPFRVPFRMAGRLYEAVTIDPLGRSIGLRDLGAAGPEQDRPAVGRPAPLFSFRALDGTGVRLADYRGRYVVVNFHASWCGGSAANAPVLRDIWERWGGADLAVIGVSLDTDRDALLAFRRAHHQVWPTSFSGGYSWEDPVSRLYGEESASAAYLIDRDGALVGIYHDLRELQARLRELLPVGERAAARH